MSERLYLSVIACAWTLLSPVCSMGAERICEGLLTPDVTVNLTKKDTHSYLQSAMCHQTFDEFKKSYGADTGAKYFEISGKGNFTFDNYENHRNSDCNTLTKEESDQSLYYFSANIIPAQARAEYVKCVHMQPLVCMFSPGREAPIVEIYYTPQTVGRTQIKRIIPKNLRVLTSGTKVGGTLVVNTTYVDVKIIDESKAAGYSINVELNGRGEGCTAYLPVSPPPPKDTIAFKLNGTVKHSSSAFVFDKTVFEPKFKLSWPNIRGIYDWDIDVTQLVNGRKCGEGKLTGTSQNFNQKNRRLHYPLHAGIQRGCPRL